jgi:iron complex outermembrane receptor protein
MNVLFTCQTRYLKAGLFIFLFLMLAGAVSAQRASGKITDADGGPLAGATVVVKGTANGAVTDANGVFSLNNVPNGSVLVVTYTGYSAREVVVSGDDLSIALEEGTALSEVIVTAENRAVSAQRVPITLDLVTGRAIQRQGAADLTQLQNLAPGLNIVQNTVFNQINVRGIGSNDGAAELSDQAVTIGVDGEYINRPVALNATLFDLDRVEVLKGPQGTLYGRNATAGAVNIIAKKPTNKKEIDLGASYGNYNSLKANAAVNLPLGKIAALRLAGMLARHDGYRDGGGTVGRIDNGNVWATRLGLSINPSSAFSIYVAGEYNKTDQQAPSQYGVDVSKADASLKGQVPTNWKVDLPKDYNVATAGFVKIDQSAIRGRVSYNFGPAMVTYTGGFRNVAMTGYQPLNGFVPETFSFDNDLAYQTQSHELRVNGEGSKLIWQAGGFYGNENQDVARGLVLPSAAGAFGGQVPYLNFFRFDVNSKTSAVFGQATYNFTEKFGLTAGIRNTTDKKSRDGATLTRAPFGPPGTPRYFYGTPPNLTEAGMTASSGKGDWNKTTWMVNLEYKFDPTKMLFAKLSTGYKAGGFDNVGAYDPEELTAIEIGSKNKFMDNKLRLNASVFNYKYDKQQVSVFISTTVGGAIQNAANTKVFGLELDGELMATKKDRFRATANFLNAEFGDFPTTINKVGANAEVVNLKGNSPIQAPKMTLIAGYDHTFNLGGGGLNVGIQTMYKSDYYLAAYNFEMDKQEAFTKTDINVTYTTKGGNWEVGLFGQNLEDNRIINFTGFTGGTINIYNWIFGAPRTFGVQLNYHFRGK